MSIVLYGEKALEFYRSGHALARERQKPSKIHKIPRLDDGEQSLRFFDGNMYGLKKGPLELLAPDECARRNSKSAHYHMMSGQLPSGSLVCIGKGVYVPSPELCFVQLARTFKLSELMIVGFELCGTFATNDSFSGGMYNRAPLTTPDRLSKYLDHAKGIHGVKKARRAIRYIFANSASPKESELHLLLCMPRRMGGCGFPIAELNHEIPLSKRMGARSKRRSYRADLYWKKVKLCVEYNSDQCHSGSEARTDDSEKMGNLESMGYTVIWVTWDQLRVDKKFDAVTHMIAKHLGKRIRKPSKSYTAKQQQLRDALLPKDRQAVSPDAAVAA